MSELLTITEVSRRSGVAASALRFYEERGLIRSERAGSGHRRYSRDVLRRIAVIVFAQRVGISLGELGADLVYRVRPAGRHVPGRGGCGPRQAPRGPRARGAGLGEAVRELGQED